MSDFTVNNRLEWKKARADDYEDTVKVTDGKYGWMNLQNSMDCEDMNSNIRFKMDFSNNIRSKLDL